MEELGGYIHRFHGRCIIPREKGCLRYYTGKSLYETLLRCDLISLWPLYWFQIWIHAVKSLKVPSMGQIEYLRKRNVCRIKINLEIHFCTVYNWKPWLFTWLCNHINQQGLTCYKTNQSDKNKFELYHSKSFPIIEYTFFLLLFSRSSYRLTSLFWLSEFLPSFILLYFSFIHFNVHSFF